MSGKIEVIAPARLVGYADDGKSVILSNGRVIAAKCVLLGTGYQSSWAKIFKGYISPSRTLLVSLLFFFLDEVAEEIGINKHAPSTKFFETKFEHKTLQGAPALKPENGKWVTSIYRGIIPAKNIEKHDFAIAGATVWDSYPVFQFSRISSYSPKFTANPGYSFEVAAHWISSYFQRDNMRLPSSVEEALAETAIRSAWMTARYPNMVAWANESYSGSLDIWT
jgi:dimethylaniline monooxygenase (N-oxide forming)